MRPKKSKQRSVWVVLARHMASKAIGYSARALDATPRRPSPHEVEARQRAAERLREFNTQRERLRPRQVAGSPWVYMTELLDDTDDRDRRRQQTGPIRAGRNGGRGGRGWVIWIQILLIAALLSIPALAVQPDEILADAVLEQRARDLSQDLRCVVCQNQSIDDSNAPLARDLRLLVRERLVAGDSDDEVMAFITDRYGDFVLLKPPFQTNTVLLWLAPAVMLLFGSAAVLTLFRRQRAHEGARAPVPLTAEEESELATLQPADPSR